MSFRKSLVLTDGEDKEIDVAKSKVKIFGYAFPEVEDGGGLREGDNEEVGDGLLKVMKGKLVVPCTFHLLENE